MRVLLCIMTLVIGGNLFNVTNAYGQKKGTEVAFCQFPLTDNAKEGNASFTLRYRIKIGEDGRPNELVDFTNLPVTYVTKEQAELCVLKWRFPDLAIDSSLIVFLRWEHGKGWTELSITGKNFKQIIRLEGERCPYSKNLDDSLK